MYFQSSRTNVNTRWTCCTCKMSIVQPRLGTRLFTYRQIWSWNSHIIPFRQGGGLNHNALLLLAQAGSPFVVRVQTKELPLAIDVNPLCRVKATISICFLSRFEQLHRHSIMCSTRRARAFITIFVDQAHTPATCVRGGYANRGVCKKSNDHTGKPNTRPPRFLQQTRELSGGSVELSDGSYVFIIHIQSSTGETMQGKTLLLRRYCD